MRCGASDWLWCVGELMRMEALEINVWILRPNALLKALPASPGSWERSFKQLTL